MYSAGSPGTPEHSSRTEQLRASPPMFSRGWIDRFTRINPHVVPVVFLPAIAICAYVAFATARTAAAVALMVAGYFLWTLTEYWIHRVVFHFEPEHGIGARLHWMVHGVHHDHPNDPLRLVMPPSVSVPGMLVFGLLFHAVLPAPLAWSLLTGFMAGYFFYDMTHYYLHHRTPRTALGRRMREAHMRHHFQDDTVGFGISAPYWDRVFRTAPDVRAAARPKRS